MSTVFLQLLDAAISSSHLRLCSAVDLSIRSKSLCALTFGSLLSVGLPCFGCVHYCSKQLCLRFYTHRDIQFSCLMNLTCPYRLLWLNCVFCHMLHQRNRGLLSTCVSLTCGVSTLHWSGSLPATTATVRSSATPFRRPTRRLRYA